ncbi:MAG: S-ribosylhomocysteine lyase [Clostridia bacterium]|nr:S-ribosylhomocysteine lyase [Clostridia bacterium]
MKKIASFQIDHTILPKGMYVSRVDGDVITYDIRMRLPNKEEVMQNGAMHTIEHLFATYVRNSNFTDSIIYVGPMGCRTGFYFLTRDNVTHAQAIQLVKDTFAFIKDFEGEIPGATEVECGNYKDHDLAGAKKEAAMMCGVLENITEKDLVYPVK